MIEISKELKDRLEEKFKRWEELKDYEVHSYNGYRHRYDKTSKRVKKWMKRNISPELNKEIKHELLRNIKPSNLSVEYYDQTGKKYRINYSLATFVCDTYVLLKIKTSYTRTQILEYLSKFLREKGIDRDPDVLNKTLSRGGVNNKILPYIKTILNSKKPVS